LAASFDMKPKDIRFVGIEKGSIRVMWVDARGGSVNIEETNIEKVKRYFNGSVKLKVKGLMR